MSGNTDPFDTMIKIEAGEFEMGSDSPQSFVGDGEGPVRVVSLSAYWIDRYAVSNDRFAAFVAATGYRTEAEKFGWSFVFSGLLDDGPSAAIEGVAAGAPWWRGIRGADWSHPIGPGSDLTGLGNHPVVHVSWNDATEFACWAGKRLPTEAEWERAARGGLAGASFPWGDDLMVDGQHQMNTWQGTFPLHNEVSDGYFATAPVDAFPPNGFGLHNVAGNVWEWTADWFSPHWHSRESAATRVNPKGPRYGNARVAKGGSYLCHASYCNRYRPAARTQTTPDSSLGHTGFRLAADN